MSSALSLPSVSDIEFIKSSKLNGNFKPLYDGKKINLTLKSVNIPFGPEKYEGRTILNIEIPTIKNHKMSTYYYNTQVCLERFDNEFSDKLNIHGIDLGERTYIRNYRESEKGYIIRTYMKNPELYTTSIPNLFGEEKTYVSPKDLKRTVSNVELELGVLWTTATHYGIVWYVKSVEVLYTT